MGPGIESSVKGGKTEAGKRFKLDGGASSHSFFLPVPGVATRVKGLKASVPMVPMCPGMIVDVQYGPQNNDS